MIGIGITTHNRYDVFKMTLENIKKTAPKGSVIIVVDDASDVPVAEAHYRFSENVGIAVAKNKCFELLYLSGCTDFFLFDDDTYPLKSGWEQQYIESKEPHLMYIFTEFTNGKKLTDVTTIYQDKFINAYSHPTGCMLYFKKQCLDVAGGMNPIFGKWGWEHPNLSDRIFNMGLTSFPYMDVKNSKGLFYSADENKSVVSTVVNSERTEMVKRNEAIYKELKFDCEFIPFMDNESEANPSGRNLIATCYFTKIKDPQRNENFIPDKKHFKLLTDSTDLDILVLNDCFDDGRENNVEFLNVDTYCNPYFQRWISYYQFLNDNPDINRIFFIDATDIEVLRNPFDVLNEDYLYVGFEPVMLKNDWLTKHHPAEFLQEFINSNANYQLVNAGIIGGSREILLEFLRKFLKLYYDNLKDVLKNTQKPVGITDMALFNYTCYTFFNDRLMFGREVCTSFKAEEKNNISVFKHK